MNLNNCVLTYTGMYVNLIDPQLETINISDIAKALSQINRFGGHTRGQYNVAQHSVMVSEMMPAEFQLQGLLHDAEEAYFGDLTNPVKYLPGMANYRDYASLMRAKIFERFGLEMVQSKNCIDALNYADLVALASERRDFMYPDNRPWPILDGIKPLKTRIRPLSSAAAESAFLTRFKELTGSF